MVREVGRNEEERVLERVRDRVRECEQAYNRLPMKNEENCDIDDSRRIRSGREWEQLFDSVK